MKPTFAGIGLQFAKSELSSGKTKSRFVKPELRFAVPVLRFAKPEFPSAIAGLRRQQRQPHPKRIIGRAGLHGLRGAQQLVAAAHVG